MEDVKEDAPDIPLTETLADVLSCRSPARASVRLGLFLNRKIPIWMRAIKGGREPRGYSALVIPLGVAHPDKREITKSHNGRLLVWLDKG